MSEVPSTYDFIDKTGFYRPKLTEEQWEEIQEKLRWLEFLELCLKDWSVEELDMARDLFKDPGSYVTCSLVGI